jgi:4-hydroxy-3-methylbut-2-enyl diphosphate reductase
MIDRIDLMLVIGSKNSSNIQPPGGSGPSHGVKGYLIDEPSEVDPAWFEGVRAVGLTAGASAPEDLVQATLQHLLDCFGGTVESFVFTEERINFPVPKGMFPEK